MASSASPSLTKDPENLTSRRLFGPMLMFVTMPVLVLDQLSKLYVSSHLRLYQQIALIPNWLDITYTLNPGAAFSLFASASPEFRAIFFIVLSIVAIIVLIVLLMRRGTPSTSGIAFALVLGGTIGNLIDRLARGEVIDFIYFHHETFNYPVFNVADSAITIGVAILLISSFIAPTPSKTLEKRAV